MWGIWEIEGEGMRNNFIIIRFLIMISIGWIDEDGFIRGGRII